MSDFDPIDWAALETDIDAEGRFRPLVKRESGQDAKIVPVVCPECGGRGCVACGATGVLRASERELRNTGVRHAAGKGDGVAASLGDFRAAYPALEPFLIERAKSGHGFCQQLLTKLYKYGSLTDGQIEAARNVWREQRRREREHNAGRQEA